MLAYLADLNQPFREDTSNTDPRFTRNRVRSELLPLLKTFNPDVVAEALDTGDERVKRIWERIENEFDRLNSEAPKAINRAKKRSKQHA